MIHYGGDCFRRSRSERLLLTPASLPSSWMKASPRTRPYRVRLVAPRLSRTRAGALPDPKPGRGLLSARPSMRDFGSRRSSRSRSSDDPVLVQPFSFRARMAGQRAQSFPPARWCPSVGGGTTTVCTVSIAPPALSFAAGGYLRNVPAAIPDESPDPDSVATAVLLDCHAIARPVRMLLLASRAIAVPCEVWPGLIVPRMQA